MDNNEKTKKLQLAGAVILVIAIAALVIFYFPAKEKDAPSTKTPYERLTEKSSSFSEGEIMLSAQNWSEARKLFEKALFDAKTPDEEAQVKFKLAAAKYHLGDIAGAVADLKQSAANKNYNRLARAYAVEYMSLMFIADGNKEATAEIFKDEPYKSLWDEKGIFLSYRKLFEHASSFYPLAVSEARIADWYANHVLFLLGKEKTPSEKTLAKIDKEKEIIRERLANVDRDIERIKAIPNQSVLVPIALERKAIVVGKLTIAGDNSFGKPEKLFDEALEAYLARGIYNGYSLYNYAVFLATAYGENRQTDVRNILSYFYASNIYRGTPVFDFFATEKDNVLGVKTNLLLLAKLDPHFKNLLMELGWKF